MYLGRSGGSSVTSLSTISLRLLNILVSSGKNIQDTLVTWCLDFLMLRFLNNPEILSGATFFGLAVITANKSVLALAILSNLSYWWFLKAVEK